MFSLENLFIASSSVGLLTITTLSYFLFKKSKKILKLENELICINNEKINLINENTKLNSTCSDQKLEIVNFKKSIIELTEASDLELILDDNVSNWNLLLAKSLFSLYTNNGFGHLINFSINEFNNRLWLIGEQIETANNNLDNILEKLFYTNSTYHNYYMNNYNLVKYETKMYFSKIRFLLTDNLINDMILEKNQNAFTLIDAKPNLIKVLEFDKIKMPYSLEEGYIKSLTVNNKFKKPDISAFKY